MTSGKFHNCTTVSPACPVSGTTYGYIPNAPANYTLAVVFGICALLQLALGVFFRTWTFMIALAAGCIMELVGYIGRIKLRHNVWNRSAFSQQIVCLIIAPSFIAAGIYLSLKHIVLYLGPQHSRLKPRLYTWVFIGCDIFSIVVQAAGGAIAGSAKSDNPTLLKVGNDTMIAGIGIQVVTMVICSLLALDFAIRYLKRAERPRKSMSIDHTRFRLFCVAEVFAFIAVLIRCIYRIPEMAGGWGNSLMRKEDEFLILDGMMVALAAATLTLFHPGLFFPLMSGRWKTEAKLNNEREVLFSMQGMQQEQQSKRPSSGAH
ncbi:uncharacterized protein PV06_04964 [Exophiala oligosperma]|uniref:RTA1 domain protein n=1 Tax=Exophiala oligosperma TaxID=215243 RepID=A0A0D2E7Y2_9EURO|nr:uncharacterized protein PV06_04964 [Exophiala oligosperma]KIW43914.1 hypothetical protein PV06_04964 [Exophiala oligosperma]